MDDAFAKIGGVALMIALLAGVKTCAKELLRNPDAIVKTVLHGGAKPIVRSLEETAAQEYRRVAKALDNAICFKPELEREASKTVRRLETESPEMAAQLSAKLAKLREWRVPGEFTQSQIQEGQRQFTVDRRMSAARALRDAKQSRDQEAIAKARARFQAADQAVSRDQRFQILSAIPFDESTFQHVYGDGRTWTQGEKYEIYSVLQIVHDGFARTVQFDAEANEIKLLEAMAESVEAGQPLVIVGHSEQAADGHHLKLPSGGRISWDHIRNEASRVGADVVILSCNSEDIGQGRHVSWREVTEICTELHMQISRESSTFRDDVERAFQSARARSNCRAILILGSQAAVATGVPVVVYGANKVWEEFRLEKAEGTSKRE